MKTDVFCSVQVPIDDLQTISLRRSHPICIHTSTKTGQRSRLAGKQSYEILIVVIKYSDCKHPS